MYLTLEHDLKFHKLRAVLSLMPPMDRLEKITNRLLWAGFILLTAGLAFIPFLLKEQPEAQPGRRSQSALVAAWFGCSIWACSSCTADLPSPGAALPGAPSATFVFVLLTFWGVNLLSPAHRF